MIFKKVFFFRKCSSGHVEQCFDNITEFFPLESEKLSLIIRKKINKK